MPSDSAGTLDEIITELGFGRYQIRNYIILSAVMLFHPFQILLIPFIGQNLDHSSPIPNSQPSQCSISTRSDSSFKPTKNGDIVYLGFLGTLRNLSKSGIITIDIPGTKNQTVIDAENAIPLTTFSFKENRKFQCLPSRHKAWQNLSNLAFLLDSRCQLTFPMNNEYNRKNVSTYYPREIYSRLKLILKCEEISVIKNDWDAPQRDSIISEWDLRGSRQYLVPLASSIFMIGSVVGSFFFAMASDKWGRKRMLLLSVIIFSTSSILPGVWAPQYFVFVTFRFFQGVCHSGNMIVHMVMLAELLPRSKRYLATVFGTILFSLGYVTLSILAYVLVKWRNLQLVTGALMATYLIVIPFLDESIYWLMDTGKIVEATKLILKAAKENKFSGDEAFTDALISQKLKSFNEPHNIEPLLMKQNSTRTDHLNGRESEMLDQGSRAVIKSKFKQKLPMLDLFRHPVLLNRTLVAAFCSFFLFQFHMALTFSVHILPGSLYVNYALMGLTEIPGSLLGMWAIRIGRRKPIIMFNVICISTLLIRIAVEHVGIDNIATKKYFDVGLYLIGRCISSSILAVISLYVSELYPTYIRNTGYGFNNAINRIGFMISPFLSYLANYNKVYLPCLLILFCLLSSISVTFLPDTKDKALPQTLKDLQ